MKLIIYFFKIGIKELAEKELNDFEKHIFLIINKKIFRCLKK